MQHNNQILVQLFAALYIFLFTYTAINKLMDPEGFRIALAQSPLIGSWYKQWAVILPLTELFIALFLFFPQTRVAGLVAATSLMVVFTMYIGYMLLFASHLPCSCGGVIDTMSWHQHLVFNVVWIGLGIVSIWLSGHYQNIIAIIRRSRKPGIE